MSSVTFPVELGGDGSTVTDDDNPSTGLRNGGWRTRFVPCLSNTVAIANEVTNRTIFGSDTSATSTLIGTGSKTFTTAGLLTWAAGMFVTVARTSDATGSNMYGQVTSYNSATNQVTINVTNVVGSGTYSDWTIAIAPPGLAAFSFTGPTTIAANSTSNALRITQTGTGNALVVEDSANPDSTPVVIDNSGFVLAGHTARLNSVALGFAKLEVIGSDNQTAQSAVWRFSADADKPRQVFYKSRSGTIGTNSIVSSSDSLGSIDFYGADGTTYIHAAAIESYVDGTPGTNDMPGRLVFSTTADGASSPTARMVIDNAGRVGIGATPIAARSVLVGSNLTGSTTSVGILANGVAQSDVTSSARYFQSSISTAAASFTAAEIVHFYANQGTIGATSAVTNQIGFSVASTLTGATNNYGFYSNIASGSGRYNFYAAGTADNYFAGFVGVGSTGSTGVSLGIGKNITGATSAYGIYNAGAVQSDVTTRVDNYVSITSTQATAFTLTEYNHYRATSAALGASSAITNQFGFHVASSLTTATNNYGFYSNIASGSGRYNFYAAGTADNYFAGSIGVGTAPYAGTNFILAKSVTGGVTAYSFANSPQIQSDVTGTAQIFATYPQTAAASFTLAAIRHYSADMAPLGAGSAITSQVGFYASSGLTGATNNYGFYSNIPGAAGRWNIYIAGTADNFFQGPVKSNGTVAGGYVAHATGTTAMVLGSYNVVKVTPNATATFTTTVAPAGTKSSIIIVTSGTTSYTITFGTGFLTTGTLATGTVTAKIFVVNFVSDGTSMIETSRTVAM